MAKKKNPNRRNDPETEAQIPKEKPSFEIGVKGDEFERRYRRAAASSSVKADRLLNDLSRESSADKYNFLGFAIPALLILITALSLTIISRGDIEERLNVEPSVKTVINGEYIRNLNEVYEQTVPFKDGAVKLCAAIGLCDPPAVPNEEPAPNEDIIPPETPVIPEPAVTQPTEPAVTTAPPETEPPVTVETEETEPESYETYTMYANATVNIRLGPSTEDVILGYFVQNDPIDVIAIRSDGWAEILYNGVKAYAYAEYMSDSEVKVTTTRRRSRTDATTETEETTFNDDDENGEPTAPPDDDSGEPTSVPEDDGGEPEITDESVTLEDEPTDDGMSSEDSGQSDGGEQSPDENGENE